MRRFKLNFFCGLFAGFFLYSVDILCSTVPYIKLPGFLFEFWLIICMAIGCIISNFFLLYKKSTLKEMVFRFGIIVITCTCVSVFNGCIGVVNFLYEFFGIHISSASDNVSGMITVTFFAVVFSECVFLAVIATIIEKIKTGTEQSGDR